MNRRELFEGLTATLAAISIPVPMEALKRSPLNTQLSYLYRVRSDLLNRIIYPSRVTYYDGRITTLPTTIYEDALRYVQACIKELEQAK